MYKRLNLKSKLMLFGCISAALPIVFFVCVAVASSMKMSQLAISESENLVKSDLDHIVSGVMDMCIAQDNLIEQMLRNTLKTAHGIVEEKGGFAFMDDMEVSWAGVNQFTGEQVRVELPGACVGDEWLGLNSDPNVPTPVVDMTKGLSVETCTVFQRMNPQGDMLRVATNVIKPDGTRAIATFIPVQNPDGTPNPVVSTVLKGETYIGTAHVISDWYISAYEPILDHEGMVAGMLYVGMKRDTVQKALKDTISSITIGKTGYVYVLNSSGDYIISQGNLRNGENILAAERGSKAVERGMSLSSKSGQVIMDLSSSIDASVLSARQISASGQQQLAGMEQLDLAIKSIKDASAQNLDSSMRLEDLTKSLNRLVQTLESQTGSFQL